MQQHTSRTRLAASLVALAATAGVLQAAPTASQTDRDFVAKVSQGGLYEAEAGKIAAMRGTTPFIKNFGSLDTHDHVGVNNALKAVAAQTGVSIAPGLNAEFTARLGKLKAVPAAQFDSFYLQDMKQIHNKDEGLFIDEAKNGTQPFKDFAHPTAVLVKAHLGWLDTQ